MPYYRITVTLKDLTIHSGIRQIQITDIDSAWEIFKGKALEHYGEGKIEDFSCIMLSKHDEGVKDHIRNKAIKMEPVKMQRRGNTADLNQPGKYCE